jgi:hypothetical protein
MAASASMSVWSFIVTSGKLWHGVNAANLCEAHRDAIIDRPSQKAVTSRAQQAVTSAKMRRRRHCRKRDFLGLRPNLFQPIT